MKNELGSGKGLIQDQFGDEDSEMDSLEDFANDQHKAMNQKVYSSENERFKALKSELIDLKDVDVFLRQKGYPDQIEALTLLEKNTIKQVLDDYLFSIKVKILETCGSETGPELYYVEVIDSEVKEQQYEYVRVFSVGVRMLMCGEQGVSSNLFTDDIIIVYDPVYLESDGEPMFMLPIFKNC